MLGIHINNKLETFLKNTLPYPWTTESINYLGIHFTHPITNMYNVNYVPLMTSFQPELTRLGKNHLTWSGRLAAYKMLILPKLMYIFRALPIPAPASFFRSMQKQLSNFVWVGKRPRCSPEIQTKNKLVGGMGLPILKDYHTSVVMDQLKNWFTDPIEKPWCQLELSWLNKISPLSFLIATQTNKHSKRPIPLSIQATAQSWEEIIGKGNYFYPSTNIPIPIETLQWIIPNIRLHNWTGNNIMNLTDITCGDKMLPFTTLQQKFKIPNSEFLTHPDFLIFPNNKNHTHIHDRKSMVLSSVKHPQTERHNIDLQLATL